MDEPPHSKMDYDFKIMAQTILELNKLVFKDLRLKEEILDNEQVKAKPITLNVLVTKTVKKKLRDLNARLFQL